MMDMSKYGMSMKSCEYEVMHKVFSWDTYIHISNGETIRLEISINKGLNNKNK